MPRHPLWLLPHACAIRPPRPVINLSYIIEAGIVLRKVNLVGNKISIVLTSPLPASTNSTTGRSEGRRGRTSVPARAGRKPECGKAIRPRENVGRRPITGPVGVFSATEPTALPPGDRSVPALGGGADPSPSGPARSSGRSRSGRGIARSTDRRPMGAPEDFLLGRCAC